MLMPEPETTAAAADAAADAAVRDLLEAVTRWVIQDMRCARLFAEAGITPAKAPKPCP